MNAMEVQHLAKLAGFFGLIKAVQVAIISVTTVQFDTSSQLIFSTETYNDRLVFSEHMGQLINGKIVDWIIVVLERLVAWDAVYFSKFFVKGVTYEHEWVFGPAWWRFISHLPLTEQLSHNFYARMLLAVFVANLLHFLSVLLVYNLTNKMLSKTSMKLVGNELAFKSGLLYVINPAGVFLTAPYSELASYFLTFLAYWFREVSLTLVNNKSLSFRSKAHFVPYLLSGVFLALGITVRTNILLVGVLYLYDLWCFVTTFRAGSAVVSLVTGTVALSGFLVVNFLPYREFCPERSVWCDNWVPFLYSFAQSHYWNVGLFKYWTLNNIPNFILPLPIITALTVSVLYFKSKYYTPNLTPHYYITYLFLIAGVTSWHVQILTRIGGFILFPYWYLASKLIESNNTRKLTGKVFHPRSRGTGLEKVIIYVFFFYMIIQTCLYAGFLPPA